MSKPEMQKARIVDGVYRNGVIVVSELPDVEEGKKVAVIIGMTKDDVEKELASHAFDKPEMDDTEHKKISDALLGKVEPKPFSIKKSKFFSNKPEHLGKTSASDLDKILADEALGVRKCKKSS